MSFIWQDEYKPKSLDEMILPKKYKDTFKSYIKDEQIPNLIFTSAHSGSGKSTLAKVLVNELKAEYLFVNASVDRGIATLRDTLTKFATTKSFLTDYKCKHKIIILDEFDGGTPDLMDAMRSFMEEYSDNCRFIFTANRETKILNAIKSRSQLFDFNFSNKKIREEMIMGTAKKITQILKAENVDYDKDTIINFVIKNIPDIRKMYGLLQMYANQNAGIINKGILNYSKLDDSFYQLILNKNFNAARKYIIENGVNIDDVYRLLYDNYLPIIPKSAYANSLITIADYMQRHSVVIDAEINLAACIMELISLL